MSYNDVRGGATAYINRAEVLDTAGDLTVEALNTSIFDALVSSSAHSSGGNIFGGGASTAISPVVSTNTVQGDSEAYISNSTIGTNGPIGGDVNIHALNDIALTAETNNRTTSAGLSVSVTLAFNTLGWEPQNILFNLVDALIGSSEIADAFGADTGAGAKAYLLDSTVDATGSLSVAAEASGDTEFTSHQRRRLRLDRLHQRHQRRLWRRRLAEQSLLRSRSDHRLEQHHRRPRHQRRRRHRRRSQRQRRHRRHHRPTRHLGRR